MLKLIHSKKAVDFYRPAFFCMGHITGRGYEAHTISGVQSTKKPTVLPVRLSRIRFGYTSPIQMK